MIVCTLAETFRHTRLYTRQSRAAGASASCDGGSRYRIERQYKHLRSLGSRFWRPRRVSGDHFWARRTKPDQAHRRTRKRVGNRGPHSRISVIIGHAYLRGHSYSARKSHPNEARGRKLTRLPEFRDVFTICTVGQGRCRELAPQVKSGLGGRGGLSGSPTLTIRSRSRTVRSGRPSPG